MKKNNNMFMILKQEINNKTPLKHWLKITVKIWFIIDVQLLKMHTLHYSVFNDIFSNIYYRLKIQFLKSYLKKKNKKIWDSCEKQ